MLERGHKDVQEADVSEIASAPLRQAQGSLEGAIAPGNLQKLSQNSRHIFLMHFTVALHYLFTPTLTLPIKGEGTFEIVSQWLAVFFSR